MRSGWHHEPALMPHEAAFTAFLAVTWGRLAAAAGWLSSPALLYATLALAVPAAALACRRWPGPVAGRLRLFAFVPLMCFVFTDLRRSVPVFHPAHVDALLQGLDDRLWGFSPPQWLAGRFGRWPTEAMSLCYGLFFPALLWGTLGWLRAPARTARAFYAGLFTLYAVGFAGYTLLPALGPYAAMHFGAPIRGFGLTRLLLRAVPLGTNRADAFPSLHCAVTAFLLGFELLAGSLRRFAWCLPAAAVLWLATLALRFHYGVDVLAGFALAGLCLALSAALLRRTPSAALLRRGPSPSVA